MTQLSARGTLVVCSAGNDGDDTDTTPHYPSSLPDSVIFSRGRLHKAERAVVRPHGAP